MVAVENKSVVAGIRDGSGLCVRRQGGCDWKWITAGALAVMHSSVSCMCWWVHEPTYMTQFHGTKHIHIHTHIRKTGEL